jgi:hypothetical protein
VLEGFKRGTFLQFLRSFIINKSLRRVLMQLFVSLIPKKASVVYISLVGGICKIIFKVLENMLKLVLGKIIYNFFFEKNRIYQKRKGAQPLVH